MGFDASDDAAVYKLNDDATIISTVDFFSPMVEDPYLFGKIAAANALSDVYAMGGEPLFALNLAAFPEGLDKAILGEILRGGAEKLAEAGAVLAGGHTIYDKEIKYGMAVTGKLTGKLLKNNGCKAGDKLILTKPLGIGIIMAALRGEAASNEAIQAAFNSMERLNKYAAKALSNFNVNGATDVTGFGLLVHLSEMVGDNFSAKLYTNQLPYFPWAYEYAEEFLITAAGQRNRNYMADKVDLSHVPFAIQELVFDPQTSGGLLISVPADEAEMLLSAIKEHEPKSAIIGEIIPLADKGIIFE